MVSRDSASPLRSSRCQSCRPWLLAGALASIPACVSSDEGDSLAGGTSMGDAGEGDGGGDMGEGDAGGDEEGGSDEMCGTSLDEPAEWRLLEDEVLALVNEARAAGADCGSEGSFASASALTRDARLACAARLHSLAMGEGGFFDHNDPITGTSPFDRIEAAGYSYSAAGENIAAGYPDAAAVVAGWLESDGHCANIMSPTYEHLGVGYALVEGSEFGRYWTQVFGSPAS